MAQNVALTLQTLRCIREKNSSSTPYIWTAFLWIDNATASVGILTPLVGDDRVVLSNNLQPGQSATIPASVGFALRPFDTEAVLASLAKTNRLAVVEEGPLTGGWAGEVISVAVEQGLGDIDDAWRITTPDGPVPYSPPLEDDFLPGAKRIAEEIRSRS